jgi:hypothetical protein
MIFIIAALIILIVPESAFAWGFETHISIGMSIIESTSMQIIKSNPGYFLCGNIFPDLFNLFRDFSDFKKSLPTHSWQTVSKLFKNCETDEQKAFTYGYCAHLSADVIAHNHLVPQHLTYIGKGRMRSHLLLEMAEESMHHNKYNKKLIQLLTDSPTYGEVFLRTMGINKEWFAREAAAIKLGVLSQKHLKVHDITRFIKTRAQSGFAEKCDHFREVALEQATRAVEHGFDHLEERDPSGKENMEKANEVRKELLKKHKRKELKKEFEENVDQKHFPLAE